MAFNMEPLKEPRGFLRLLQWFFAMIAFATCCDFSVKMGFQITCKPDIQSNVTVTMDPITTRATYPFSLDQNTEVKFKSPVCSSGPDVKEETFSFPGTAASNAEFFVFMGVITWLYCFATLALYVFYSYLYTDEQKSYPKIDLIIAAVLAFIWLASSSGWAHGLLTVKGIAHVESWIYEDPQSPCFKADKDFKYPLIEDCKDIGAGGFGTGNASILIGFLNCFLWTCNTWFLYKETSWYRARNPGQEGLPAGNI